jgi:hypothetical protein
MPQSTDQVAFALKPLKVGEGWHIVATHPSGQQELITGFHSEAEAKEWLAGSKGFKAWLKTRGYANWWRANAPAIPPNSPSS